MRAYRQTFKRHRLLYLLPPLIAALALGGLTYSTPKSYQSTASLWVDNQASSTSSLDVGPANAQAETPSAAEQTVLDELLATSRFDRSVVSGAGLGPGVNRSALAKSVATGVASAVPGPQVLQVTFSGASPAIAHGVVASLLTQLANFTAEFSRNFGKAAVSYDQAQLATASRAVSSAKAVLNNYSLAHPRSTPQNDAEYASLNNALATATASVSTDTAALNQAQAQAQGSASGTTISVLDQPSFESAPLSGMKKVVLAAFGGGIAGLILSLLLIIARTPAGEDRWDQEISYAPSDASVAPLRTATRVGRGVPAADARQIASRSEAPRPSRRAARSGTGARSDDAGALPFEDAETQGASRNVSWVRKPRSKGRPSDDASRHQNEVGGGTAEGRRA